MSFKHTAPSTTIDSAVPAAAFCAKLIRLLADDADDLLRWAEAACVDAVSTPCGSRRWVLDSIPAQRRYRLAKLLDIAPRGFDLDSYLRFLALELLDLARACELTRWEDSRTTRRRRDEFRGSDRRSGNGRLLGPLSVQRRGGRLRADLDAVRTTFWVDDASDEQPFYQSSPEQSRTSWDALQELFQNTGINYFSYVQICPKSSLTKELPTWLAAGASSPGRPPACSFADIRARMSEILRRERRSLSDS